MELNQNVQSRLDQIARLPMAARWGLIGVCAGLVAGGYFLMVYRDTSTRLEKMRAQEFELQRRLSEVRSVAANLHEFEEEIARLELKLSKVLRQLPDNKELEVLLTDISNLGKKSGIEIKSFKRKEEIEHGFYAEVPIAIELEGEYQAAPDREHGNAQDQGGEREPREDAAARGRHGHDLPLHRQEQEGLGLRAGRRGGGA
jgi:type IV pilus assembly protein PilO